MTAAGLDGAPAAGEDENQHGRQSRWQSQATPFGARKTAGLRTLQRAVQLKTLDHRAFAGSQGWISRIVREPIPPEGGRAMSVRTLSAP